MAWMEFLKRCFWSAAGLFTDNLLRGAEDLSMVLLKHQEQKKMVEDDLRPVKEMHERARSRRNRSDASFQREAYNENMMRVVEKLAEQVKNWIQEIDEDYKKGGKSPLSVVIDYVCDFLALGLGFCTAVMVALFTGPKELSVSGVLNWFWDIVTAGFSYVCKACQERVDFASEMKLLRKVAEERRREIGKIKMDLELDPTAQLVEEEVS